MLPALKMIKCKILFYGSIKDPILNQGSPGGSDGKDSACSAGKSENESVSHSVISNSLKPHGL